MKKDTHLFVACIVALVTTSFGFIVRAFLINEWGVVFNLSEMQKGSILGAGLYPFALSIIFFSLVVDRLGYGRTMAFAWVAHVVSAIVTMTATSYAQLYIGTFIFALANGAVEAAINPVTATLYPDRKTHFLNVLHAGWPGGLVLGGLLAIAMGGLEAEWAWRLKIGLFLIPAIIYGWMLLGKKFPQSERVAAGVSYLDMLKEFGWASCFLCMIFVAYALRDVMGVFEVSFPNWLMVVLILGPTIIFAVKVRNFGRPMFVILLLVMILLATTELGTDSWIASLLAPVLADLGGNAGNWVLIYTSAIMFVLRFFAGPIVDRISPLGLLAVCSLIACIGLLGLSASTSAIIVFLAATIYAMGKTFFWPTTIGLVAEQFPRGGALTINAIAGVGMISVGVLGGPLLGALQDKYLDENLKGQAPIVHEIVAEPAQSDFFLTYQPLDKQRIAALPDDQRATVEAVQSMNSRTTLSKVAVLPFIMFLCYIGLILFFRTRGGYRVVQLDGT